MSLDVYLTQPETVACPSCGHLVEVNRRESYWANITHNLNRMADAAEIYQHLWRPEELGITKAAQLVEPLRAGLNRLRADPEKFKMFNPKNGWGDYDGLVEFVGRYLEECEKMPNAEVSVSR